MSQPQKENGPVAAGPFPKISAQHQLTPVNHFPKSSITTQSPDSTPQLLTPAAFKAWHSANAASLREADERNQRAVDDYIIRTVINAIQSGATLEDAGDAILGSGVGYGFRGGVYYTKEGFRRALRSIDWRPKRERAGGASE